MHAQSYWTSVLVVKYYRLRRCDRFPIDCKSFAEMAFSLLALVVYLPTVLTSSSGSFLSNGQTQLTGSSFGILGNDATFDYVVRVPVTLLHRRARHLK